MNHDSYTDLKKNPLMNYGSSKSAKIVLSKSIFDVKNQLIFFKKNLGFSKYFVQKIRWPKPRPINEKLRLRPINRLIGRPLYLGAQIKLVLGGLTLGLEEKLKVGWEKN